MNMKPGMPSGTIMSTRTSRSHCHKQTQLGFTVINIKPGMHSGTIMSARTSSSRLGSTNTHGQIMCSQVARVCLQRSCLHYSAHAVQAQAAVLTKPMAFQASGVSASESAPWRVVPRAIKGGTVQLASMCMTDACPRNVHVPAHNAS